MLIKIPTSQRTMNIIQIFAPTYNKTVTEIEEFNKCVDEAMHLTKRGESTMIMGDFNIPIPTLSL